MNEIKATVAKNIAQLRQAKGMTQLELAEYLNYSDKAVSKWERGESLPDIAVLMEISRLFDVSLDYLVNDSPPQKIRIEGKSSKYSYSIITIISIVLVWFLALLAFVLVTLITGRVGAQWLTFVYAIPVSAIVWLPLNTLWFNPRRNYPIISLLMWSVLASVQLSFLPAGIDLWLLYLLGIPGQAAIFLWSKIRRKPK